MHFDPAVSSVFIRQGWISCFWWCREAVGCAAKHPTGFRSARVRRFLGGRRRTRIGNGDGHDRHRHRRPRSESGLKGRWRWMGGRGMPLRFAACSGAPRQTSRRRVPISGCS